MCLVFGSYTDIGRCGDDLAIVYLSGAIRPEFAGRKDTGYMLSTLMGNKPDLRATLYALDNGCFNQPERFDLLGYVRWLDAHPRETCLFATAPDVVGDARATYWRSKDVMRTIRNLGFPVAYVAQDGIAECPPPWDEFDVLFMGGTTAFKLSEEAYALVAEAKARGKRAHMGRVNSLRRLRAAEQAGYDSADGTFVAFGGDKNVARIEGWLRALREQPVLARKEDGDGDE